MNAPFISSEQSALELANYLLNYYKHQHLIVRCSVPCKDGFELEVGDILKFNVLDHFTQPPIIMGNLPYNLSTKIIKNLLR